MIRSIYAKIFLWFWLAMVGVFASVIIITLAMGAEPLGRRWISHSLDLYAHSAVDFYTHGGQPQLQQYLDDIQSSSRIQSALFDPQSLNVLNRDVPPGGARLIAEARATGKSQFSIRFRRWTGAAVVSRPEGNYIFVAQYLPLVGFVTPPLFGTFLLRLAIALLSAGLLSLVLARHIAAPIRALQIAAGKIANGDLSVRALPTIKNRNDELADLARDFDLMAERVHALMHKQQELLGDISHELRSPLARLGVSLELVRRGEMDGIERMQTDLDRLDHLIGQILTLTRLQNPGGPKNETTVNLRATLESVAADARFECQEEGKSVVIDHAGDVSVKGDALLLRSCIENVVRNAIRYTAPGTAVNLSLQLEKAAAQPVARLTIADHGPGVPPESISRLFEPFYRVAASRDRNSGGTGLGLAIAQRVVLFHRGTITARNRTPAGLEVEIVLPALAGTSNPAR
ncbi:MAG TPA: ATP-binding protein [Candidatus Acidoferrales bacterium]